MKYQSSSLYLGNILKKDKIIKQNVLLGYNSYKDTFYDYMEIFKYDYSLNLEPEKLTKEEQENYKQKIIQNTFFHHPQDSSEEPYVDESSITAVLSPCKEGYKR